MWWFDGRSDRRKLEIITATELRSCGEYPCRVDTTPRLFGQPLAKRHKRRQYFDFMWPFFEVLLCQNDRFKHYSNLRGFKLTRLGVDQGSDQFDQLHSQFMIEVCPIFIRNQNNDFAINNDYNL